MKHVFTHLAFLCLFGSVNVFAQQDPHFSQYMHNKLFMNPAYAGIKHALCFSGIMREQWSGFEGAPRSGVFSADIYSENLRGGVGLNVMYDQLGFEKNMAYRLSYSFHIEEILGGTLAIGLEAGLSSKTLGPTGSQSWVASTNWQNDPVVPNRLQATKGDFAAGLWYQREEFWFGLSASHINGGKFTGSPTVISAPLPVSHSAIYDVAQHYWITGGYNYQTRLWTIQPSFVVKSDAIVTSIDLNCIATYNDLVWFGASYRYKDAICPMIGFNWVAENKVKTKRKSILADRRTQEQDYRVMRIGFAYDYTTSQLGGYNNGTFELFLSYCLPWVPATSRHGDVRNFQ
jgi:type IX secretion system PorP/SprF family membrane protein